MKVYLVRSKLQSLCGDGYGLKQINNKRECSTCLWMNSEDRKHAVDVVIVGSPGKVSISVVKPPAITIIRKDFIETIGGEARQFLNIGRVYTTGGNLVEDFISSTSAKRLPIRGNENSMYRECEECGRLRYSPRYPWYVLENSLFGQPIYEPWPLDGLVVNEEIKNRLNRYPWKGIQIIPLPVIRVAKDGLLGLSEFRGDL